MNAQRQVAGEPMTYGPSTPPSISGGGDLPGLGDMPDVPGVGKLPLPGLDDIF